MRRLTGAVAAALLVAGLAGCSGANRPAGRRPGREPEFLPVSHASFVLKTSKATIYVDPVGKPEGYAQFPPADVILITDVHGDHLAPDLLKALRGEKTRVVGPGAVVEKLGFGTAMANGEKRTVRGVGVEAVPMYNTTKERLKFHPRGRGNGYVLEVDGKRIYISGDTEDVPEMRALRGIDYALVCMNLPYTMTVEQAASAVLEMKPKVALPYHYRSRGGKFSDVGKFRSLVAKDPAIEVRLLDWYPK
ncbi:MAG: MBL fold metallo-hydrolase [Planctomycetota bacterium]|jgi:L-ascorbate metabolism protein UlaG (beta-lactamase superfamily)